MIFPWNTTEPSPRLRASHFGALAATVIALSIVSAPASAETIEGAGAPPTGETSTSPVTPEPSAAAQTPIPVAAAPEPVQTELPSTAPSPDSAADNIPPVVPTPSEEATSATTSLASTTPAAPVSAAPVDRALPRSAATVNSAADAAIEVGEQAGIDTDALPTPVRQAADLLDSVAQMSEEAAAPTGPSPAQPAESAPKPARVGAALTRNAITPGLFPSPGEPLTAKAGESRVERVPLSLDATRGAIHALAGSIATAIALTTDTNRDNRPAGGHTPSHLPPPAPDSPATAVASSGGTSFVPLAALLALLALAAPATLRRLGRAPDFQVPTRFVCALERPG